MDRKSQGSTIENPDLPPRSQSSQGREYIGLIRDKIALLEEAKDLIPVSKVQSEIFSFARIARNSINSIPDSIRRKLLSIGIDESRTIVIMNYAKELTDTALDCLCEINIDQFKEQKTNRSRKPKK